MSADLDKLKGFILSRCVYARGDGEFNPCSGKGEKRKWVFDIKKLGLHPEMMEVVADLFYEKYLLNNEKVGLVAAEFSGAIISSALSAFLFQKYGKTVPQIIVRKKRKKYGTCSLIEGDLEHISCDEKFVFIDDVVNSGSTVRSMLKTLNFNHPIVKVSSVFTVINFGRNKTVAGLEIVAAAHIDELREPMKNVLEQRYSDEFVETVTKWEFKSPTQTALMGIPKSSPLVFENRIMFGSDSGIFWCLNKNTGDVFWSYDTKTTNKKGILSSPSLCLNNTAVTFGDYSGHLTVLRVVDGSLIYKIKLCDWIGSSPLVIDETEIVIGAEYRDSNFKGGVVSVSIGGEPKVNWSLPLTNVQHSSAVYSKEFDKILTGSNDGVCYCLNRDGTIYSELKTGGPIKYHPAVFSTVCAFGSFDGNIYIWDFIKEVVYGKIPTEDIVYSQPLIHRGKIYVGSADSVFFILDFKGNILKKHFFGEKIHASPVLYKDKVYCGCSNGNLVKIDTESLEIEAVASFSERLTNKLAFDDESFFVYDYLNNMRCINQF